MRVVLDTNIWMSGLILPKSISGEVLSTWQQAKFGVVTSQPILNEIQRVLAYPKIYKIIKWDKNQIEQYIQFITFFTESVALGDIESQVVVEEDPNDSPILVTLICSNADYLVTGDNDLLCLQQKYPIINLADFYKLID